MQTPNWRERFDKEFTDATFCWNGDNATGKKFAAQQKRKTKKFIAQVEKESIERAIEVLESKRRKYLHTVVAIGSQEHLNDTFREGYNQCIEDSSEALKTLLH